MAVKLQAASAPVSSTPPAQPSTPDRAAMSLEGMMDDDGEDDADGELVNEDAIDETGATRDEDADGEDAESAEDEGEDTGGTLEDEEESEGEEQDSKTAEETDAPSKKDDEPADVSKGLEELAKSEFGWAAKRIARQSEDIKKLRARETVQLTPTTDYPLAGITTEAALKAALSEARETQKRLSALQEDDFTEGRDGQPVAEVLENGKRVLMTRAEVAAALANAEARLNDEVIDTQKQIIAFRAQTNPREQAEALVPGILQPGTEANNVLEHIQRLCPALLATLPDPEVFIAHAYRSFRQHQDTLPTKDYPKGRKKIVVYDLDKDGKVIPPKRTDKPAGPKAGGKPNPSLPRPPVPSRAPLKAVATTQRDAAWGKARKGFVNLEDLVDAEAA